MVSIHILPFRIKALQHKRITVFLRIRKRECGELNSKVILIGKQTYHVGIIGKIVRHLQTIFGRKFFDRFIKNLNIGDHHVGDIPVIFNTLGIERVETTVSPEEHFAMSVLVECPPVENIILESVARCKYLDLLFFRQICIITYQAMVRT